MNQWLQGWSWNLVTGYQPGNDSLYIPVNKGEYNPDTARVISALHVFLFSWISPKKPPFLLDLLLDNMGGFHSHGGTPSEHWMVTISWKIPRWIMIWGYCRYPYDLGKLQICEATGRLWIMWICQATCSRRARADSDQRQCQDGSLPSHQKKISTPWKLFLM